MNRGEFFAIGAVTLSITFYILHHILASMSIPVSSYSPYFIFFTVYLLFVIILPEDIDPFRETIQEAVPIINQKM
jgi:hypothetical protein